MYFKGSTSSANGLAQAGKPPLMNIFIFEFQMSGYFNEKSGIAGHVPLGSFNAMFNFTGSSRVDAAATKSLAMVGYLIPLCTVKLAKQNLILREDVRRAVPYTWDPAALAR